MNHVLSVDPRELRSPRYASLTRCHRPSTMVGHTPVLWISEPSSCAERGFWAKLEGSNPGGMKDRPAMHMVERGRARGDLQPGARIVESTSGTFGLGLALAGTVYRHPVTLVTDPGMEPIIQRMLTAYGAEIDLVTDPHPTGGWQQARRERVAELLAADPDAWYPDQYNNPDNVDAYRPLASARTARPTGTHRCSGVLSRNWRSFRRNCPSPAAAQSRDAADRR
jgi:S-sulfo-L-cysteine synthase (3-phospho-L-serine-dependent)